MMMRHTARESARASRYTMMLMHFLRKRSYSQRSRYRFPPLPACLLVYVTYGRGKLLLGERLHELEPQQLYCIPAGVAAEVAVQSERLDGYVLAFSSYTGAPHGPGRQSLQMQADGDGDGPTLPLAAGRLAVHAAEHVASRLRHMEETARQSGGPSAMQQLQFQELLHLLLQEAAAADPGTGEPGVASSSGLERAIAYMEANYPGKLDMGTLASVANLTPSSFSRVFKKKMGRSPIEYLTQLRINSAKDLLLREHGKIKDISAAVGYEDEFHFSRLFHREVGVPPTMYMKRSKLKVAVAACLPIAGSLQSLGVMPVADVNCFRYPGMGRQEYETILAAQLEELRRAEPDLIVCDFWHEQLADVLRELAPAVQVLKERKWEAHYGKLAAALGRDKEAEQTIRRLAMQTTAARQELRRLLDDRTVMIVQVSDRDVRIQGGSDHPLGELVYGELGVAPGRNVMMNARRLEVPPEWLPQVDADHVFVFQNHHRANSEAIYERLRRTPVWQSIKAVRKGKVRAIPNWFKLSWSPQGREAIVEELLTLIRGAEEYRPRSTSSS